MRNNDLTIISPPDEAFQFHEGTSTDLEYLLHNTTNHSIRNIDFKVVSLLPDGRKTKNDYVRIGDLPMVILPHKQAVVKVNVTVPEEYNETLLTKSDGEVLVPFRLHAIVNAKRYVEEPQ